MGRNRFFWVLVWLSDVRCVSMRVWRADVEVSHARTMEIDRDLRVSAYRPRTWWRASDFDATGI